MKTRAKIRNEKKEETEEKRKQDEFSEWLERKRRGGPIDGSKPFLRFPPRRFVTPPHLLCFSRFASVSPRFFIPLFARAFRHLTPVVSRHHRGCPTATQRTSFTRQDVKGMRELAFSFSGDRRQRDSPSPSFVLFRHFSPLFAGRSSAPYPNSTKQCRSLPIKHDRRSRFVWIKTRSPSS